MQRESDCRCECHRFDIVHVVACCYPDDIADGWNALEADREERVTKLIKQLRVSKDVVD